jgi:hypothetical protein
MTCFFDVDARHAREAKDAPDDHPLVAHFHDWRGLAPASTTRGCSARSSTTPG